MTNLCDLEQTFAPFPDKAPLSLTHVTKIKIAVDAQAHNKEIPIFR